MLSELSSLLQKYDVLTPELITYYLISSFQINIIDNGFQVIQCVRSLFEQCWGNTIPARAFAYTVCHIYAICSNNQLYEVLNSFVNRIQPLSISDIRLMIQSALILTLRVTITAPLQLTFTDTVDLNAEVDKLTTIICDNCQISDTNIEVPTVNSMESYLYQSIDSTTSYNEFIHCLVNITALKEYQKPVITEGPHLMLALKNVTPLFSYVFDESKYCTMNYSSLLQTVFPPLSPIGTSCLVFLVLFILFRLP